MALCAPRSEIAPVPVIVTCNDSIRPPVTVTPTERLAKPGRVTVRR